MEVLNDSLQRRGWIDFCRKKKQSISQRIAATIARPMKNNTSAASSTFKIPTKAIVQDVMNPKKWSAIQILEDASMGLETHFPKITVGQSHLFLKITPLILLERDLIREKSMKSRVPHLDQ